MPVCFFCQQDSLSFESDSDDVLESENEEGFPEKSEGSSAGAPWNLLFYPMPDYFLDIAWFKKLKSMPDSSDPCKTRESILQTFTE
jgi:hypothetical protein